MSYNHDPNVPENKKEKFIFTLIQNYAKHFLKYTCYCNKIIFSV